MTRIILAALAALSLAACASTPTYTPASAQGRAGYSETQLESNRFLVTYRAGSATDVQRLEDFALLRSADIALQNNADWFWVDRRTVDTTMGRRSYGPSIGIGIGSWGGNVGGSVGVNVPLGGGGGGERATAASLEIRLGQGAKPDEANAYDARAIAANLRARYAAPR
jgi:hypothetical protein